MRDEDKPKSFKESTAEQLDSLKSAFPEVRGKALSWFHQQLWEGRTAELLSYKEVLEGFFDLIMNGDPAKESEGVNFIHALLDIGEEMKVVAAKGCETVAAKLLKNLPETKAEKLGRDLMAHLNTARDATLLSQSVKPAELKQG